MAPPPYPIIATTSHRRPRYGLLVLGALVLAGAGIGAALMLRPAGALPVLVTAQAIPESAAPLAAQTATPATAPAAQAAEKAPVRGAETAPLLTRSASVCLACGTVEAVVANGAAAGSKAGSAYQVQVRMDDGTLRNFTSATQPQPGAAVRVQGDSFRMARAGG